MHLHIEDKREKNLIIVIFLNFFIFTSELLGGIFSRSLSLLSDSFHNLSDTISIVISLIAIRFSKRESSYKFTFGGKRAEIIASLFNSIFLFIVSFVLIRESIIRLTNPQIIQTDLMLIIAIIGLFLNGISVILLKNFSKDSMNIKSSYLHLLMDTLSSIAVVIGGILMMLFKIYWIDAILTLLITLYILKEGIEIFIKSIKILMEQTPKGIDLDKLKNDVEKIEGISNLHHIHIWQIDEKNYLFEGHIKLKNDVPVSKADCIRKSVEDLL
ncbi:MAG TPA: cation diffusion facilitator family transporter, partial [Caldisericia bacterium]|nr:cation diffusion facilitator family transporter [Caldisericia bacterium]HRU74500.1 cation diffusion facilitator family transporter [Caldisericia bacterium]